MKRTTAFAVLFFVCRCCTERQALRAEGRGFERATGAIERKGNSEEEKEKEKRREKQIAMAKSKRREMKTVVLCSCASV